MMPLCSAFAAAHKTDALSTGNIAQMSLQQWVGTNVALCCCRMNMPSAVRANFADCNAHARRQEGHQQTAVEAVCAKVASRCPGKSKLLKHDDKELLTRRSCSSRMQMQRRTKMSCPTRRSCGEKELRRELSPQSVLGECDFPSHMKKLTLLGTSVLCIHSGDVARPSQSLASTQLHYDVENTK